MESCCEAGPEGARGGRERCPSCGSNGRDLDEITLKALLTPQALPRLEGSRYRFCPSPACPVVYFGADVVFGRDDVTVPVFQKEASGCRTVCYCFDIREDRILQEVHASGASPSAERIKAWVHAGRCACEVRNPQGTCCLGNVATVVASAPAPVAAQASPVTA